MSDYPCAEEKKSCPYKIFDIEKNIIICNFFEKYWDIAHDCGFDEAHILIRKACERIKNYKLHQIYNSKLQTKKTIQMLKNIEIGDTLFWDSRNEEVRLAEKPTEISSMTRCRCRRHNSEIVNIPAHSLCQISKGNFSGEYFIDNTEDNEGRAKSLEYWAKCYGFRAEIVEKNDGKLLKVFGDSQKAVNDFINLYFEQNRVLN